MHMPWWVQTAGLFILGFAAVKILTFLSGAFFYLAIFLWIVVVVGYLHAINKIPKFILRVAFMKDILDRLTDKSKLEGLVEATRSVTSRIIDAEELSQTVKSQVFGQDNVCDDVAKQIRNRFAKSRRSKPIGVFMFAGPPATGKTWFAKVLSRALYGDNSEQIIEMTQYSEPHTAATLFGQAKGYAGSDKYGVLTGLLRTKADQVIVLDEIEKAHDSVHKRFLSAWNDGFITEQSTGEKIATTDAIFILTTNAQQKQIAALAAQFEDDPEGYAEAAKRELSDAFAPEVLSRIDRVFPFLPLKGLDVARIVVGLIESQVNEYDIELDHIEPEVLLSLIQDAMATNADPRQIARDLEGNIASQVVDLATQNTKKVRIEADESEIRVLPA